MNLGQLEETIKGGTTEQLRELERRIEILMARTHPHLIPKKGDTLFKVMTDMAVAIGDLQEKAYTDNICHKK